MRLCCLSCAICIHYYGLFAFSLQTIKICSCGNIYMNNFIVKLPVSKGKCLLHIVLRLACIYLKTDSCSFLWRARPCPLSDTFDLGGYKVWESLGIPVCTQCTGKREFLFTELYKDLQVHTYIFISLFFSFLDGITIFRPSTFFIKILSSVGVQIRVQMKPVMQLSIMVDHSYQNRTSGRTYHILSVCS